MISLIVIAGLLIVMWLVLIRPQRRRQLKQADLLSSLEPGVEIVTAGGLYGTVVDVDEDGDEIQLAIAPDTVVRVAKRAVAAVMPDEDEDEYEEVDEDDYEDVVDEADESGEADEEPAPEEARSGSGRS